MPYFKDGFKDAEHIERVRFPVQLILRVLVENFLQVALRHNLFDIGDVELFGPVRRHDNNLSMEK